MRTNLKVPYEDRETAKKLGAKWDGIEKTWYIEDRSDLDRFLGWIPEYLKRPWDKSRKPNRIPQKQRAKKKRVKRIHIPLNQTVTVTGPDYHPVTHKAGCNVLPWDECSC